jgi:hypothetical protein
MTAGGVGGPGSGDASVEGVRRVRQNFRSADVRGRQTARKGRGSFPNRPIFIS